MLTGQKMLAKISTAPGKTRLINHFLINEQWYLVDLPGYGYAKVGHQTRKKWEKLIETYLLKRESLMSTFLLVDSRLPLQDNDRQVISWFGENQLPFVIVMTKTDKLSRVEAGAFELKLRPTSVSRLIETAMARLGRQFEDKGVVLETDVPPDLPPVQADEGRIGQVLLNLVGNALQYTPPEGRVTIRAQRRGDAVLLAVQDTGIGIAPDHLPHVFERFYRVDKSRSRAGGGSGIGLTIAQHLVEAHGGQIQAASDGPGRGSVFSFTLPAV
jgi:ribosome biogenesis GTP-binding protein YsxC/EngB